MVTGTQTSGVILAQEERARLVRQKAGEFTMQLVKALLQTGYYSADHPVTRSIIEELYGIFRQVVADAPEITYVVVSSVDERSVVVEGLLPEPIEVSKAFRGLMGDHFCLKFHEYFMRNQIASFTIKRSITEEHFHVFAGLWVGWSVRSVEERSAVSDLSDELARRGIFEVTVVKLDEVVGHQRHLVWPVRIALSRLRKDLSRLPLLKNADRETIARLKAQVIGDVVRPITRPEMLRDLVLNADLVSEGLREINRLEVEQAIIGAISPKPLYAASQSMVDFLDSAAKGAQRALLGPRGDEVLDSARRCAAGMLVRLAGMDVSEAKALLEASYARGLIPLEVLPEDIRRHIKAVEMTEKFLAAPQAYIEDFERCSDPRTYLKYLNVFALILPELMSRRLTDHVAGVFLILSSHMEREPFPGCRRFIADAMPVMERAGLLDDLLRSVTTVAKEHREGLEVGISLFGAAAVPGIILMLSSNDDMSTRRSAFSMLHRIGAPAIPLLMDELRAHRHGWATIRNLICVLGDMQALDAVQVIMEYMPHPHPRVREECAVALAKLLKAEAQPHLLKLLDDKDDIVVRRVIHLLSRLHSTEPQFLEKLVSSVSLRRKNEPEPHDWLQVACLRALAEYEHVVFPDPRRVEQTLCDIVRPPRLRSLLPGRFGVRAKAEDKRVFAAIALGVVGSAAAIPVLSSLLSADSEDLRKVAGDAIRRIEARAAGQRAPAEPSAPEPVTQEPEPEPQAAPPPQAPQAKVEPKAPAEVGPRQVAASDFDLSSSLVRPKAPDDQAARTVSGAYRIGPRPPEKV